MLDLLCTWICLAEGYYLMCRNSKPWIGYYVVYTFVCMYITELGYQTNYSTLYSVAMPRTVASPHGVMCMCSTSREVTLIGRRLVAQRPGACMQHELVYDS